MLTAVMNLKSSPASSANTTLKASGRATVMNGSMGRAIRVGGPARQAQGERQGRAGNGTGTGGVWLFIYHGIREPAALERSDELQPAPERSLPRKVAEV